MLLRLIKSIYRPISWFLHLPLRRVSVPDASRAENRGAMEGAYDARIFPFVGASTVIAAETSSEYESGGGYGGGFDGGFDGGGGGDGG